MIFTNFFANSDSFGNQKAFSNDSSKTNTFTEDFAAFFDVPVTAAQTSVPVLATKTSLPVQAVSPQNNVPTKTTVPTGQNIPADDYQTESVFWQDGIEPQKPGLFQTNNDRLPEKEEISPADDASFAAFINVPILTAQASMPISAARTIAPEQASNSENFVETKNVVTTNQNPPGEDKQVQPVFLQNGEAGQNPDLIQPNNNGILSVKNEVAPSVSGNFAAFFKMPVSAATSFAPAPAIEPGNIAAIETIVPPEQNSSQDDYQTGTVFLQTGEDAPKPDLFQTNRNIFPVKNEILPIDSENVGDPKSTPSADIKIEVRPDSNFFGEISNRSFAEKNNYVFQINSDYQNTTTAGFTVNLSLESVAALSSQIQSVKPETNNFSTDIKPEEFLIGAARLFVKDSDVETPDVSIKTNVIPEAAGEQEKIELINRDMTKEIKQTSVKPIFKFGTENQLTPRFTGKAPGKNILESYTYTFRTFIHHENSINKVLTTILRNDYAPPLNEQDFLAPKQAVNDQVIQFSPELSQVKVSEKVSEIFSEIPGNRKTDASYQANSEIELVTKQTLSEQSEISIPDNKISGFQNRTQPNDGEAIQISPELNQKIVSSDVPKLFDKFLNAAKSDKAANTSFTLDSAGNRKIVEQIKQSGFGAAGQNLNEPKTPGSEKQSPVQDNAAARIFDNLLGFNVKNPQNIEGAPLINDLKEKVFGQIEPQILELANRTLFGNEKKIFKMRLNPAELGAVEVTVEKSSSGVISAHFQTESETTRHILNESLVQLRNSLENSGCPVGNLEISCGSFSSNGNERRGDQSRPFGATENQRFETTNLDGNSNIEDDDRERLVSLRA